MSGPEIRIAATGAQPELMALQIVLDRFSDNLAGLGPNPPLFRLMDHGKADVATASITLSSVLPDVLLHDIPPWAETEAQIRGRYAGTSKTGPRSYVCTAFRHVPPDAAPGLRARIRKLNLLVADISRTTGIFVIDIDRCLADVGARAYATDYRLTGPFAAEAVAREMAATFLATGFDAPLSREARERLKSMLADWHPTQARQDHQTAAFHPSGPDSMSLPRFSNREAQAADFVRQALRGQIRPGALAGAALRVIQRDGLGGFALLAWKGLRKGLAGRGR